MNPGSTVVFITLMILSPPPPPLHCTYIQAYKFEHRDLHWGNILLRQCSPDDMVSSRVNGAEFQVESNGIHISLIDFTLSRMTRGKLLFTGHLISLIMTDCSNIIILLWCVGLEGVQWIQLTFFGFVKDKNDCRRFTSYQAASNQVASNNK